MHFEFKPLSRSHLPLLLKWLNAAHVRPFWEAGTLWTEKSILEKYGSYIEGFKIVDGRELPILAFVIYREEAPLGFIQLYDAFLFPRDHYNLKEVLQCASFAQSRLGALDIFIGEKEQTGKGIGSAAVKQFLFDHVWPHFDACLVDPEKNNAGAIRAYEKAGFDKMMDSPDRKEIIMIATDNVPRPTGPHQIGCAKYDLTDVHRKELEYPEGRLIPIQIYFPMQKGEHALHAKIIEQRVPGPWEPLKAKGYSQKADLSRLVDGRHPLVLMNPAKAVSLADYAFLAEDLASHGYIVVSIQHHLNTDQTEPRFWMDRSLSRNARIIDTILYVFEWLKERQESLFALKIDLKRTGLIGHSMGGNALLFLAYRTLSSYTQHIPPTLLPREDPEGVRECIIAMDPISFPSPFASRYPLFFLLSEEREAYQNQSGCYAEMNRAGHQVRYYKGAKHTSFMDHGYSDPPNPSAPGEQYFKGTVEERKAFFDVIRNDIRDFLNKQIGKPHERH